METIRIGICDDEDFFCEELEKLVSVYANDTENDFDIHTYSKAEDVAMEILEKNEEYHILFLDVEMDGMTGMEAAQKLRREGYNGVICFVSSQDRYAFDAFGVEAIGYVKKPAKYQDVKHMVQKALIKVRLLILRK